mgnify:CR=1 FL=1
MRGDLSDQLQRAQSSVDKDDQSNKIIIGVAIIILVAFIAAVIAGTIFIIKFVDKVIDTPYDGPTGIVTNQYMTNGNAGGLFSGGNEGSQIGDSNFIYGTVDNNKYYSQFSGITFYPGEDWMITSYADNRSSTRAPKDITASGPRLSSSVTILYENMASYNYSSAEDALTSVKTMINSNQSSTVYEIIDDNAIVKWGGNKLRGIIYTSQVMNSYKYYTEVLVAEINGYALKISIKANSNEELEIVRSYFS